MADEELRRLEREAEEDPALRGRYLAEALRSGAVTRAQLAKASYVGDVAADELLEHGDVGSPMGLSDMARGLMGWGPEAVVRAGLALGERLLPEAEGQMPEAAADLRAGLQEARGWLDTGEPATPLEGVRDSLGGVHHAVRVCWQVPRLRVEPERLAALTLSAAEVFYRTARRADRTISCGSDEARRVIRDALVPWILSGGAD